MGRKKATPKTTTRVTRSTKKSESPPPLDEDEDWSSPASSVFSSRPAKKLHYSLDALLEEKENAPPPVEMEQIEDINLSSTSFEIEEDNNNNKNKNINLDSLAGEGYNKTAELREILNFEDELKRADESLSIFSRPYYRPSISARKYLPLMPSIVEASPKKSSSTPPRRVSLYENSLRSLVSFLSPDPTESLTDESESEDEGNEEGVLDLAFDELNFSAISSLFQPINNHLLSGNQITNEMEKEICSGIVSLLLSKVAYLNNKITAGAAFSLLSSLFQSSNIPGPFISSPSLSLSPSPSLSAVFWADQFSPSLFYSIWKNYGFTFLGKGAETEIESNDNNNTTSSSSSSSSIVSSSQEDENETSSQKSSSTQLTFPNFNYILVIQLLRMCIEVRSAPFSSASLRVLLNQSMQLMLDNSTCNAPHLSPLFISLLHSLLQIPQSNNNNNNNSEEEREKILNEEQQKILAELCDDFMQISTSHRIWTRIAESIPLSSFATSLLRTMFSCKCLEQLSSSYLIPFSSSSSSSSSTTTSSESKKEIPSLFLPKHNQPLLVWMGQVVSGEYKEDVVLLSVVQLVGLGLGPYLGSLKGSLTEVEDLKRKLQTMNTSVKEAGYHTMVKTKVKNLLIVLVGQLSLSGGKKGSSFFSVKEI